MRIIFHVGLWKTGTTYLQTFVCNNREQLKKRGIFCPGTERANRELIATDHGDWKFSNELLTQYIEEWQSTQCETMLLTCEEFFYHINTMTLDLSKFETLILCYIRQAIPFHNSAACQSLKATLLETPSTPLGYSHYHVENFFTNMTDTFLTDIVEQIHRLQSKFDVSLFSYEEAKKDYIAHFLRQLGETSMDGYSFPEKEVNVSIPTAELFFYSQCNLLYCDSQLAWKLLSFLENNQCTQHTQKYLLISPQAYRDMVKKQSRELQQIAEWLDDPDWIQKSLDWLEDKELVPYKNLPVAIQHEIFNNLPKDLQNTICTFWPYARGAKPDEPLLPDFPQSFSQEELIRGWGKQVIALSDQNAKLAAQVAAQEKQLRQKSDTNSGYPVFTPNMSPILYDHAKRLAYLEEEVQRLKAGHPKGA